MPATIALYEMQIRLYLKPGLGKHPLRRLSVPIVQKFLNDRIKELKPGQSVRNVHVMRQILSAALSRAMREELVARNVARLVELPPWEAAEVIPWSAAEALAFLDAAAGDPLHPAFALLLLYGLRRGEVLGLAWADIDDDTIRVRQQVQRVAGQLRVGLVKTTAGKRDLPVLSLTQNALAARHAVQALDRERLGAAWSDTGLVFTSRSGLPIEPRNVDRTFARVCTDNGLRRIRLHDLRHTTATLLRRSASRRRTLR